MSATAIQMAERLRLGLCAGCGEPVEQPARGGRRKWCSGTCRQHALYSGECVDCGAATYNGTIPPPERCQACNGVVSGERARHAGKMFQAEVEAAWAEGLTHRQMAKRFGWSAYSARGTHIATLRARGYNLPHRRTPEQIARITFGADEWMAKARAARRSAT